MLYYTPPPENIFREVQKKAIELWREIDTDNDKYGYASEKIGRIKDLQNLQDNFMYIVAMFDPNNQHKLFQKLSTKANIEILRRLLDTE